VIEGFDGILAVAFGILPLLLVPGEYLGDEFGFDLAGFAEDRPQPKQCWIATL
jgi:hypothetical protein